MKERPILFSGAMVRAILDGKKTQTRRVVKTSHATPTKFLGHDDTGALLFDVKYRCPYGEPGDRLWVREAWRVSKKHDVIAPRDLAARKMTVMYEAGGYSNNDEEGWRTVDGPLMAPDWRGKYRPPMFMPRWASRINLEVTGVRVERLQEISYDDALAEGVADFASTLGDERNAVGESPEETARRLQWPQRQFRTLWDGLNAERGFSFEMNPWVFVIEFKRTEA